MGQRNELLQDSVFQSSAFKDFQREVVTVLENPEPNPLLAHENMVSTLVDSQNSLANWLAELNNDMTNNKGT